GEKDTGGNFGPEQGGGTSHFGRPTAGAIHDNQVVNNGSYDEGAGVMIAGEPNPNPTGLSAGAGSVTIYDNLIQGNLANDDGGGLRFLQAGNDPIRAYNNMIVNNVSTHEGRGLAVDDHPNLAPQQQHVDAHHPHAAGPSERGGAQPAAPLAHPHHRPPPGDAPSEPQAVLRPAPVQQRVLGQPRRRLGHQRQRHPRHRC